LNDVLIVPEIIDTSFFDQLKPIEKSIGKVTVDFGVPTAVFLKTEDPNNWWLPAIVPQYLI
jgi:hypothetical protein